MIKLGASRTNYAPLQGRDIGAVLSHLTVVSLRCSVCASLPYGPKPHAMHRLFLNASVFHSCSMILFSAFNFSHDCGKYENRLNDKQLSGYCHHGE